MRDGRAQAGAHWPCAALHLLVQHKHGHDHTRLLETRERNDTKKGAGESVKEVQSLMNYETKRNGSNASKTNSLMEGSSLLYLRNME